MLEPTKEPVKPVSAAEMIASIAQTPPVVPAKSSCPPDTAQVGPESPPKATQTALSGARVLYLRH